MLVLLKSSPVEFSESWCDSCSWMFVAEMKTGNRNKRTSLSNIFAIFVCLGCRGSNENETTIVEYLR